MGERSKGENGWGKGSEKKQGKEKKREEEKKIGEKRSTKKIGKKDWGIKVRGKREGRSIIHISAYATVQAAIIYIGYAISLYTHFRRFPDNTSSLSTLQLYRY